MRRIPDIVIAVCVIFGVTAIAAGFRRTGGIALGLAALILAKRRWAMLCIEGMVSQDSAGYQSRTSDPDYVVDSKGENDTASAEDPD